MKRRLLSLAFLLLLCTPWLLVVSPGVEAHSIPPASAASSSSSSDDPTCPPQILVTVPFNFLDETTTVRLNDCAITALLTGQAPSQFDVVASYHPIFGLTLPKLFPLSAQDQQSVRAFLTAHRATLLTDPCLDTNSTFTADAGFDLTVGVSLGVPDTLQDTLDHAQYHSGSCTK